MSVFRVILKPSDGELMFTDAKSGVEREYLRDMNIQADSEEEARLIAEETEMGLAKDAMAFNKTEEGQQNPRDTRRYVVVSCEEKSGDS